MSTQFFRESTNCFAKSLWIRYEISMNSLFFSWFHWEFIIFTQFNYLFREFTMNPLSFSRNHNEFTILFSLSLWVHYLFRESSMDTLFVTRYLSKFTICFAKSLLNRYLLCEFTIHRKSISWIWLESTIFSANQLWYH